MVSASRRVSVPVRPYPVPMICSSAFDEVVAAMKRPAMVRILFIFADDRYWILHYDVHKSCHIV